MSVLDDVLLSVEVQEIYKVNERQIQRDCKNGKLDCKLVIKEGAKRGVYKITKESAKKIYGSNCGKS